MRQPASSDKPTSTPPFLKMHIHFVERSRVRLISNSIKNNNGLPGAQAPSDFKQFLIFRGRLWSSCPCGGLDANVIRLCCWRSVVKET